MPQSKVVTDDQKTRLEFKSKIAKKVEQALAPKEPEVSPEIEPTMVIVPANFHTVSKVTLYGILTHERGLSPEDANEVIEILGGKKSKAFTLILEGIAEEEPVQEEPQLEIKQLAVELPYNFKSLNVSQKFLWLSKESHLGLSFEEANDIIDLLDGKPTLSNTEFHITFSDPPLPLPDPVPPFPDPEPHPPEPIDPFPGPGPEPVKLPDEHESMSEEELFNTLTHNPEFTCSSEMAIQAIEYYFGRSDKVVSLQTLSGELVEPRKVEESTIETPKPKPYTRITVEVPEGFSDLRVGQQYIFLTRTLQLSPEFANDVIALLGGKSPLFGHEYIVNETSNYEFSTPIIEEVSP